MSPLPTTPGSDATPLQPTYDQVAAALLAVYLQLKVKEQKIGQLESEKGGLKTENAMVWKALGAEQKKGWDEKMAEQKGENDRVWRELGKEVEKTERLEREIEGVRKEGQKKVDRVHGEKGQVMKEKKAAEEKVVALQADKLQLQQQVRGLTGIISLHDTLGLKTQIEELEGDIEQLHSLVKALETRAESTETENELLNARDVDWETEYDALTKGKMELDNKNARLQRAAGLYRQRVGEHQITIVEQQATIAMHEAFIDGQQREQEATDEMVIAKDGHIASLKKILVARDEKILQLEGSVDNLEACVAQLKIN